MATFSQWQRSVDCSIMLRGDTKARDAIAFMCWSDEQSGGRMGTWHASAVYHMTKCACSDCVGPFMKTGRYPGRTGEQSFA